MKKKPTNKTERKARPRLNCNRFRTCDDAIFAFTEEVETVRLTPSAILFAEWLFAPVAKRK